jgi:hypothetical protein
MALGRVRPYAPRTAKTRAVAEEVRRYLEEELREKPTLRHVFYHVSGLGLVPKTEQGYEEV